ncbi:MAG: hypothetical protein R6V77_07305 [Candidatus Cloacimonadaceae bacterium]
MKKANLFIWLIVLVTLPVISIAQSNHFSLYFYNSSKQRRFEQSTSYKMSPFKNWQMQITGRTLEDKRIDFDQISRNSFLYVSLFNYNRLLTHNIQTGYEYLTDYSSLESELNPYLNRTGFLGYGVTLSPLDSLRLETSARAYYRHEQDRYKDNHELISSGFLERFNTSFSMSSDAVFFNLGGNAELKKLDWEEYKQFSASLSSQVEKSSYLLQGFVNASTRSEDLYVLQSPDLDNGNSFYDKYDKQYKKNLTANLNMSIPVGNHLNCEIMESYSLSDYRHEQNKARNTGDYNNLAQLNLSYKLTDNIMLHSNNAHSYYIKDLSYVKNSRIIDIRTANANLAWEYVPSDSILFDYTIELRRTQFPDSNHRLDNDYLTNTYKLGWILYWKDRMRVANRLLYWQRDDVFINAVLSANNSTITGLQWQPECDILLGDSFLLHQDYQIRADYDNYKYNLFTEIKDTFYRRVSASYHLVYDSTPLAAKLTLPKWNQLPYRSRRTDAFRADMGYDWERNETGVKTGNEYLINGIDERHSISCLLQAQHGIAIMQMQPKYSWGTWKEYSLMLSSAWQLNRDSLAEIRLNPIGSDLNDLDWRVYCSLNLLF